MTLTRLLAMLFAVGVRKGFDSRDVQKRDERGMFRDAVASAESDVQAVLHPQHQFGVTNRITVPAAGDDLERLKRLAVQQFLNGVELHAFDSTPTWFDREGVTA